MLTLSDSLLVFTDLDGSLLDHETYDWTPALPWLARLKAAGAPVIINTSKTAAEIMVLRDTIGLQGPFIAENGASIHLPAEWVNDESIGEHGMADVVLGASYHRIREVLEAIRETQEFMFSGFGDFSDEEVAECTGLDLESAHLAHLREASEPMLWHDSDEALERFELLLVGAGLSLTRGGRFYHVMSERSSKGRAMAWLTQRYAEKFGITAKTIGLGDGPNDVPMLDVVDAAVVIRGHHNLEIAVADEGKTYRTRAYGPAGWAEGMAYWLGDGHGGRV
ncbi:mannosyl-3-phosphoglycerate phosphatase-related protein [Phytohalomonas tamaricis]|uniref:mannosyl-3-phosphoglycerate phosphatase-related protein n=1 Tax=Phytohalomonas tamaricis TaxID=2081032 RepID=UPI000D0B6D9E|nr:mannosyl-3-phosphoglycerate phosphatase-related protein [Phytohalomonas tamaricis]